MPKYLKVLFIFISIFLFIPSVFLYVFWNSESYVISVVAFYLLFIAPLIFVIVYFLAGCKTIKEKLIFWMAGFVLPFIIIYYWAYCDFLVSFHPI